jgi:hypothetical protein
MAEAINGRGFTFSELYLVQNCKGTQNRFSILNADAFLIRESFLTED